MTSAFFYFFHFIPGLDKPNQKSILASTFLLKIQETYRLGVTDCGQKAGVLY
jgi:hypothetical protein